MRNRELAVRSESRGARAPAGRAAARRACLPI
jgi:hypothetical protein